MIMSQFALSIALMLLVYWLGEVDWILAMEMPYWCVAWISPCNEVWLKDLSLKPPVSETMQALNEALLAGGVLE